MLPFGLHKFTLLEWQLLAMNHHLFEQEWYTLTPPFHESPNVLQHLSVCNRFYWCISNIIQRIDENNFNLYFINLLLYGVVTDVDVFWSLGQNGIRVYLNCSVVVTIESNFWLVSSSPNWRNHIISWAAALRHVLCFIGGECYS